MKKRKRKNNSRLFEAGGLISAAMLLLVAFTDFAKSCADGVLPPFAADADLLTEVIMPDSVESQQVNHYKGMRLSFNPRYHIPNWVAWALTAEETRGDVPRSKGFYTDRKVKGCALPEDYRYSGYDRGHMAPAGDMKWDREAMAESFSLANICPQAKQLNTGAWKKLEEKCRQWAVVDSVIVIVCGPVLTREPEAYIGASHVAAPESFFKVVLAPYANPPRGIGFLMPNGKVPGGIQKAAVSIDSVEAVTGFDFFAELPDSIESVVESQCDFPYWSTLRR